MQNNYYKIIITFTLLQLIILYIFGYTPYPDSEGYIKLAHDSLIYNEPYPVSSKLTDLAFIWNIAAINMVALSLKLFYSITPLLIVYSIMKGFTAWLIFQISRHLFKYQIAFITLIIYVLYPSNYGEGTSLLSETPNIFFSFLGLYLSICKNKNIVGGGMIAIANCFRPISLIYLIAIIIYQQKKALKTIVGYIIISGIIGFTNYYRTGYFIYQAQTGWMALLQYSVDNTPTNSDNALPIIKNKHINATEKDKIWRKRFFDWLQQHPTDYVIQMPKKIFHLFASDNVNMCTFLPSKQQRSYLYSELSMKQLVNNFPIYTPVQYITIFNLVFYYTLLILFIISLFKIHQLQYKKQLTLPLSIITLNILLVIFVGHGEARFHYPFMPFIIMIDALLLNQIKNKKRLFNIPYNENTTKN